MIFRPHSNDGGGGRDFIKWHAPHQECSLPPLHTYGQWKTQMVSIGSMFLLIICSPPPPPACFSRKIGGKHDCDFRDHLYGRDGPYSLFTLAIKFSWLHTARLLLCHGFNANKYQLSDILALAKESTGSMDSEEAQQLVGCLLAAGYKVQSGAGVDRVVELLCSCSQGRYVYNDWLRNMIEQPSSLKQLCRTAVRAHLRVLGGHTSILQRVSRTGLPRELQDYVNMVEFCEDVHQFEGLQDTGRHLLYFAMPRRRDRGSKPARPKRTKTAARSKEANFW